MNENIILQQNEDFIVSFTRSIIINIKQYQNVLEDIYQQARMAFLMAVRKFDNTLNNNIQNFSKMFIQRAVFRTLNKINNYNKRHTTFTDNEMYQ